VTLVRPGAKSWCALTFDDGPDPVWTPAVIDRLRQHELRATFYVIGSRVRAYPELVSQMLEVGHEVGVHCTRHIRHTELTDSELAADTDASLQILDAAGVAPRTWRTPWGVQSPATRLVAAQRGLKLIGWGADTHDWRGDGAADMLATVAPRLASSVVVLMHDGIGPGARRDDCTETVELIGALARKLGDSGIETLPVSELVA
jgi:peptidoglycan/xylan/chitin deacetylase (PgdA/CDA1 family)